ncbi:MAG: hypothetical protein ACODAC_06055 [Pseudomonadota bacterium]
MKRRLKPPFALVLGIVAGLAALGHAAAPDADPAADAGADAGADAVRDVWLPSRAEVVHWHWQKDRHGPALTGNASWQRFMAFLETELAQAGVVDLERNAWSFERWRTSHWPDDSRWSLTVAGRHVEVASFGANSGSTGPDGVTAPLALYEPGDDPESLAGRIAVLRTRLSEETVRALAETDYEYRSPPESYPEPGKPVPKTVDSVSWRIFPQLMQTRELIATARDAGAEGAVLIFDAGREQMAGMYTFPVPERYDVPTLMLDRGAGARVVRAARAGASATLRLEAEVVRSEAYQLVGFLPGRHYGTPQDEQIQLVTHTDGPSVSQDNGALGILALVRHYARLPREERPRTLMVFLDARHFMPGQEAAFPDEDYFVRHPDAREDVVAVVGMEHLGQIEYVENGDRLEQSGRVDPSMIWTTDDPALVDVAVQAVQDNGLPSAAVRNVDRPGIHGRGQGRWYGMASFAREAGLPGVAIMGTMGAYWATSSGVARLDPGLFRRQVATFVQITDALMHHE